MSNVPPGGPMPPAAQFPAPAGTVVVERYRLEQPVVTDLADAVAWQARDTILDRPVRLTFLVQGPRTSAALDAARRAALVSDPRLTRVLDVGTARIGADAVGYVVTEPYTGSTLTEIISSGLVDTQQARALIGEVSDALSVAAQRGVHHLALRPDAVRVDGHQVVITGLGIDAGLAGVDATQSTNAASDARDLAALAYYALTARWAGDSLDEPWLTADVVRPLPAQVDHHGIPVPLTSLVPHVDPALDSVVTRALSHAPDAPRSPGEVAEALRPWGEVSVVSALPGFVQPPVSGVPVRQSVRPAGGPGGTAPVRRPTGRIARSTGVPPAAGAGTAAYGSGTYAGAYGSVPPPPPPAAAPTPPVGASSAGQGYPPQPWDQPAQAGYVPAPPPAAQPPQPAEGAFSTEEAPRRRGVNPTPIVLSILLVGVIAAAGWAVSNALRPVGPPDASQTTTSPSPDGTDPADETDGTPTEDEPPPTEPEVRPIIDVATQIGPAMACSGEQPEQAVLAVDSDPSTFWFTCTYNDPHFGGIKDGAGLAVTLREPAPVTSVTLLTNSEGGHVQIRKATVDNPTEGPVLAEGAMSTTTELKFAEPQIGDSFVVWVTELPQSAGRNRLELNEIILH